VAQLHGRSPGRHLTPRTYENVCARSCLVLHAGLVPRACRMQLWPSAATFLCISLFVACLMSGAYVRSFCSEQTCSTTCISEETQLCQGTQPLLDCLPLCRRLELRLLHASQRVLVTMSECVLVMQSTWRRINSACPSVCQRRSKHVRPCYSHVLQRREIGYSHVWSTCSRGCHAMIGRIDPTGIGE
jgi:hypothetical protein